MSTDDFSYGDPEKLFLDWLDNFNRYVDTKSIVLVKKAFLKGYELGIDAKRKIEWVENIQK